MEKIKQLIENFLIAEAEATTLWYKSRDIAVFNAAYDKKHFYTFDALNGNMGLIPLQQPESDDFYERGLFKSDSRTRFLFKISNYQHPKYAQAWVAYVSHRNPRITATDLCYAFIIIPEDNHPKMASIISYTDLDPDLQMRVNEHKWVWLASLEDLDFESLGKCIAVERFLEPRDEDKNLKLYLEDK